MNDPSTTQRWHTARQLHSLISTDAAQTVEDLAKHAPGGHSASPAELVEWAHNITSRADNLLAATLAHARQHGVPWSEIATHTGGGTASAAQQRHTARIRRALDRITDISANSTPMPQEAPAKPRLTDRQRNMLSDIHAGKVARAWRGGAFSGEAHHEIAGSKANTDDKRVLNALLKRGLVTSPPLLEEDGMATPFQLTDEGQAAITATS